MWILEWIVNDLNLWIDLLITLIDRILMVSETVETSCYYGIETIISLIKCSLKDEKGILIYVGID